MAQPPAPQIINNNFNEDLEILKGMGFVINVKERLGAGNYGVVYSGTYGPNAVDQKDEEGKPLRNVKEGLLFACKYVDFEAALTTDRFTKQELRDSYQIERLIMKIADNQNITPLQISIQMGEHNDYTNHITGSAYTFGQRLYLVMDFAGMGSLNSFMANRRQTLKPTERMSLIKDCFWGLKYLHDSGIGHGDVHVANVLIFHDHTSFTGFTAKWNDFGKGYMNPNDFNDQILIKKKRWDCKCLGQRIFEDIWKGFNSYKAEPDMRQLYSQCLEIRRAIECVCDLERVLNEHKFRNILERDLINFD